MEEKYAPVFDKVRLHGSGVTRKETYGCKKEREGKEACKKERNGMGEKGREKERR